MPEPIPYGYTNRSGEWRCEEGGGSTRAGPFPTRDVEVLGMEWVLMEWIVASEVWTLGCEHLKKCHVTANVGC